MIELDHVSSHAVMDNVSTMFPTSPSAKIAKLASWMPEQVVESTVDSYPADSEYPFIDELFNEFFSELAWLHYWMT